MTRPPPTRRRVAALLAGLVLVAAGCADDPRPEPDPPPTYLRPSEGLCERIGLQDILRQRWRLALPPKGENDPRYFPGRGSWAASCDFTGFAEDGRYDTKFGFRPSGLVDITVYHEVAHAVTQYNQVVKSYRRRVPSIDPGGTVTEITGWWDAGISVRLTTQVDSGPLGLEDPGTTDQLRELVVRHDNLLVELSVHAHAPTKDKVEVGALLDEIARVMLDESVKHLPRTTG